MKQKSFTRALLSIVFVIALFSFTISATSPIPNHNNNNTQNNVTRPITFSSCTNVCERTDNQCKKMVAANFSSCRNNIQSLNITNTTSLKELRRQIEILKKHCELVQKNESLSCKDDFQMCKTTCLPLKCKANFTLVDKECVKQCALPVQNTTQNATSQNQTLNQCKKDEVCARVTSQNSTTTTSSLGGLCVKKQKEKQLCLSDNQCGTGFSCNMKVCLKSPVCNTNNTLCTEMCYGLCAKAKNSNH